MEEDTGEKKVWQIVGEPEADAHKGKISVTSPIARALIGKTKDDIIEVDAPGGAKIYKVRRVVWLEGKFSQREPGELVFQVGDPVFVYFLFCFSSLIFRILGNVRIVGNCFLNALNETRLLDLNAMLQLFFKDRVAYSGSWETCSSRFASGRLI